MGDDAGHLLILDSNLIITDSIKLYAHQEKRIPKAIKPDLEGITLVRDSGKSRMLLVGSGSLVPYRNIAVLIDPRSKQVDSVRLDVFYQRLLSNGLQELNLEGITTTQGSVILSNRGHKSYPKNYLVFTTNTFWKNQAMAPITVIPVGFNSDSLSFSGVSGICYAPKGDRLLMTVSTEDTRNALEDGAIGKSYLWIVKNISAKRNWKAINPDQVIDLDDLDSRFRGQKIESICVTMETRGYIHLVLAADNDDGSSTLFKLIVEKE